MGRFCLFLPLPSGGASLILPSASPHQQRLGCFSRFLPLPSGDTAPARPSVASPRQRLGQFCLFLPLPSGCTAAAQPSVASHRQRLRYFPRFSPLPQADAATQSRSSTNHLRRSFRLQKFTLRPSSRSPVQQKPFFCTGRSCKCLPYRRRPVSVPDVPERGSRTGEGCFLYGMWNLALSAGRFSLEVTDRLCLKFHPLLSPCTFSAES